MSNKVKYTLALPTKVSGKLDDLAELESASKSEVLRKAITLYSYIQKEVTEKGLNLCIADDNGKILKTIVSL